MSFLLDSANDDKLGAMKRATVSGSGYFSTIIARYTVPN